jgi:hypothetical protein
MVNVALGDVLVFACDWGDANGDGQITVDEILTAVNNALNGCWRPVPRQNSVRSPQTENRPGRALQLQISTRIFLPCGCSSSFSSGPYAPWHSRARGELRDRLQLGDDALPGPPGTPQSGQTWTPTIRPKQGFSRGVKTLLWPPLGIVSVNFAWPGRWCRRMAGFQVSIEGRI